MLLVVDHGTFTEAARRAHLTQPALSASILRLEKRVGARLFDRGRHGAQLTAAGATFLPRARATIAAFEDGVRAVAEVEGLHAGEVSVGAGATVCTYFLPRVLAVFRRRHPGITVRLREAFHDQLVDDLHDGDLDLIIVPGDDGDRWRDDELILVAAPGVTRRGAGYVTFAAGSSSRRVLLERFPDANIVMELGSIAAVKGHVRAGVGMALISRDAVKRDLRDGSLVELSSRRTPVLRRFSIRHRGVARLPPAAACLRELLLTKR